MSAPNLNDRLARNEYALAGQIYKDSINDSVWNKLVPKEAWPKGLSDNLQVVTVNRNLPENIDTWTSITPNEGSNTCVPVADVVPRGNTVRTYSLVQKALESEDICVNDTRNAFQVAEQVRLMYEGLRDVVSYTWKRRAMLEYFDVAEHKVVAAAGLPESSSHMPTIAATSILNQTMLNKIYMQLISNSAQRDGGSLGMADGRPQFVLITSMETSDSIMRESGNVNAFLWNKSRVPELLMPLGVDRPIRGYYHTIDTLPRRWNFTGGAWVEVQPYETVAATKGYKAALRPEYLAAPFEDSYVFLPSVMTFMVPDSIGSVGSGTDFNPQSYVGDFKWKNIIHRTDNPDGAYGYYRAVLQSGTKPVKPQFGFVIRHLRCPNDLGLQACPVGASGASSDLGSGESFLV